jgi:hypothetical protein
LISHPEITVATGKNRLRHHGLHVLRHDADIDPVAAVVAEAVEAQAILKPAEIDDIVLEPDVGTSTTTTTATTTTAAAEPTAAAAEPAAAASSYPTAATMSS